MIKPAAPGRVNPEQFERVPGSARRYIHIATGEEVSRRQAIIGSSGYTPEEAVAARRGVTPAEYQATRYERAKARAQAEGYATPYRKAQATPTNVEYWKQRAREETGRLPFKAGQSRLSRQTKKQLRERMGPGYWDFVRSLYKR